MHTIGASVALNWQGGSASLSGHFEGARFSGTTNLHRLPPFLLLDIDVNQRVGKNTVFFAGVKNVLNQSYESFKDYPMPGISLTTGLRFNFGAEGGI
jgi:outer membrane receptor protein involved in Fe transport